MFWYMNQIPTPGRLIKLGEMPVDDIHAPSGEMGEKRVLTKLEVLVRDAKREHGIQVPIFNFDEHLSEDARAHNVALSRRPRHQARQTGRLMVAIVATLPPEPEN